MPRKTEFDTEKAIGKATHLFWRKGYSNTSLRDLLKEMAIGEGSFYNAFKSKKQLYLACLKHYNDTVSRRRLAALMEAPTVHAGIRAFFKLVLDELDNPKTPRICLMAGSMAGDVLGERELKRYVIEEMAAFQHSFIEKLEQAKTTGEIPDDFPVAATAQILMTYLQGLFRLIGVLNQREEIEAQLQVLFTSLGC